MKEQYLGVEGSPATQMIQLMRKYGHNKDVSVDLATVTVAPPKLEVKLEGDDIVLNIDDDLIVPDHLLDHERIVTITEGIVTGDTTCPDGAKLTTFTDKEAKMVVKSPLEVGSIVIVIGDNDTDMYYLVGKAVI